MFKMNEKIVKSDGVRVFETYMLLSDYRAFIHGRSLYMKVDIPPRRLYWAKQN